MDEQRENLQPEQNEAAAQDAKKTERGWESLAFLHDMVYLLAIVTILFTFFFRLVAVDGSSMYPTLVDKDYLVLESNFLYRNVKQGDIVVLKVDYFDKPIVKRVIATHVGMTPEVGQQNTEGTLEVNLLPQGTLAECIRAGGAGLGGVLTPVGIDTLVEDSPFCLGRQTIDGKDYLLMKPIHADFALLGAYKCDEYGNCWYKGTMRNFNVVMATAADTVIAECEYIVPVGDFEPENIHTYGMCVDYIVEGDRK